MTISKNNFQAPHLPGGDSFDDLRVDIEEAHQIADQVSCEKHLVFIPARKREVMSSGSKPLLHIPNA
jgi:hypothetical protein